MEHTKHHTGVVLMFLIYYVKFSCYKAYTVKAIVHFNIQPATHRCIQIVLHNDFAVHKTKIFIFFGFCLNFLNLFSIHQKQQLVRIANDAMDCLCYICVV